MLNNYERIITSAVATTTTAALDVDNRVNIGVSISASGISSGNGALSVDASNDGTNWVTGIAFIDAKSTTPATRVTTLACSSNTVPQMLYLGSDFGAKFIRVKMTFTTDGVYTVDLFAMKRAINT